MFFYLSKVAWFFLQPSNLLVVAAVLGSLATLGRFRALGRAVVALALAGLLVAGFSPLGQLLVLPLEERFPARADDARPPTGIVVLGGSLDTGVSVARGKAALNEASERLMEFAALARRYPDARLLFTGGHGEIFAPKATEADVAAALFEDLGLDPARIELENRSRNTWQNATLSRELASPRAGETWLLVTSAWHMPRAVGAFRAAGFPVEAYPVDYRTRGWRDAWRPFHALSEGLRRTDVAMREWIGLGAYWLTGRSEALFPAP